MDRGIETAEEAHFLVRVGTWTAEDLDDWYHRRWGGEFLDEETDDFDDFNEEVDGVI